MRKTSVFIFLFPLCLMSCEWESSYQSKSFLHYSGTLMACRDIHGADLLANIDIGSYPGEDYSLAFNRAESALSLGVEMTDDGTCKGVGKIRLISREELGIVLEREFEYYLITTDLSAGRIISTLEDEGVIGTDAFVYINATWSRITIPTKIGEETANITFQFWCVSDTGYPDVFSH